ncbi:hypothetical protein GW755_00025 [bacterium]|nr:hypothetical protein [bacterium]
MSFTALIAQYSLLSILGLDGLSREEQDIFNLQAARLAFKNALVICQEMNLITKEQMDSLSTLKDPLEVQNKIVQLVPGFTDITVKEVNKIKILALKTQINDFLNFADTKIKTPETKQKVREICTKLLSLIDVDALGEDDQKTLDQYQMLRSKLNFSN